MKLRSILFTLIWTLLFNYLFSQQKSKVSLIEPIRDVNKYSSLNQAERTKLNALRKLDIYESIEIVKVNSDLMSWNSSELDFRLPALEKFITARLIYREVQSKTNKTWVGELEDEGGKVYFYQDEGGMFGHFWSETWEYQLQYFPDSKTPILIKRRPASKESQLNECRLNEGGDTNHTDSEFVVFKDTETISLANLERINASRNCDIGILVVFTPGAQSQVGNINQVIQNAISQTNTAFTRSQISANSARVYLSGSQSFTPPTTYTLSGSTKTWGEDIFDDTEHLTENNTLATLRSNSGADLVILLVEDNSSYSGLGNSAAIGPDEDNGFAIVQISVAEQAGMWTFSHEFGHLMGARHQESVDPGGTFNHGHQFVKWFKKYRTIMAVPEGIGSGTRYQNYSNPDVDYLDKPTGVTNQADNTRQIRDEGCTVASFFTNNEPLLTASPSGPIVACEGDYVTFNVDVNGGGPGWYSYEWRTSSDGINWGPIITTWTNASFYIPNSVSIYYVQVKVTSGLNQTITASSPIYILSPSSCNYMKATSTAQNVKESNKQIELKENSLKFIQEPILRAFPVPAKDNLNIEVILPKQDRINLTVVNLLGQTVKSITDQVYSEGLNAFSLNITNLNSGIYFLFLNVDNKTITKKIQIIK